MREVAVFFAHGPLDGGEWGSPLWFVVWHWRVVLSSEPFFFVVPNEEEVFGRHAPNLVRCVYAAVSYGLVVFVVVMLVPDSLK